MVYNFFTSVFFLFFALTTPATTTKNTNTAKAVTTVSAEMAEYNALDANSFTMPAFESFEKAVHGYNILKAQGKITKEILTLVDFSKSSNTKRLWIIDMKSHKVLYNTLVAHGRNSGDEFATQFSNNNSSNMSSLGFYATGEIYNGKHGESMRLDGLEAGFNSNARSRAVVMHAADYVCDAFAKQHKRIGRSQGCPALPNALNKEIIHLLKNKSCLFIYHPTQKYLNGSRLLAA